MSHNIKLLKVTSNFVPVTTPNILLISLPLIPDIKQNHLGGFFLLLFFYLTAFTVASLPDSTSLFDVMFTSGRRIFKSAYLQYVYRTFPVRCQIDV